MFVEKAVLLLFMPFERLKRYMICICYIFLDFRVKQKKNEIRIVNPYKPNAKGLVVVV